MMKVLSGQEFKAMVSSGSANLENYQNEINTLNVFPVPDGDTGTNMSMTFSNGAKEANNCLSNRIGDVAKSLSKGLLMGARGNSGVITSQIFRGFYLAIEDKDEVNAKEIAEAFENGARVAYKAIMKPIEGTILTVIREASWYANHDFENNPKITIEEYFSNLYRYMSESLIKTPDLLPQLKEAGVVDSGGAGLLRIIEGFNLYLQGQPVKKNIITVELNHEAQSAFVNEEFGYCTEFILRLNEKNIKNFDENILKNKLAEIGESLVLVKDDDLVKVHVHTLRPGEALNLGQRYGEFIKLKIENMSEQHSELIKEEDVVIKKQEKAIGIISVAASEEVAKLMKDLGVDEVISGGQTMNPSTNDFIEMIEKLDYCNSIVIFPNNKNIYLAAKQASELIEDKKVVVIDCFSIQACLSSLAMYNPNESFDDNCVSFNEIAKNVKEINVTYAVKDTNFDGVDVKQGDYIAMANKTISASGGNIIDVVCKAIDSTTSKDDELVTIITGIDSKEEETEEIVSYIEDNYDLEVEIVKGNVPIYYYLIGIE